MGWFSHQPVIYTYIYVYMLGCFWLRAWGNFRKWNQIADIFDIRPANGLRPFDGFFKGGLLWWLDCSSLLKLWKFWNFNLLKCFSYRCQIIIIWYRPCNSSSHQLTRMTCHANSWVCTIIFHLRPLEEAPSTEWLPLCKLTPSTLSQQAGGRLHASHKKDWIIENTSENTVDGSFEIRRTSWYGRYPIIYVRFYTSKRWLFGISEPSAILLYCGTWDLDLFVRWSFFNGFDPMGFNTIKKHHHVRGNKFGTWIPSIVAKQIQA